MAYSRGQDSHDYRGTTKRIQICAIGAEAVQHASKWMPRVTRALPETPISYLHIAHATTGTRLCAQRKTFAPSVHCCEDMHLTGGPASPAHSESLPREFARPGRKPYNCSILSFSDELDMFAPAQRRTAVAGISTSSRPEDTNQKHKIPFPALQYFVKSPSNDSKVPGMDAGIPRSHQRNTQLSTTHQPPLADDSCFHNMKPMQQLLMMAEGSAQFTNT